MPHVAARAQTTLSATAIDFGGTTVGQVSVVHRITFTNTQSVALSISSLTVSGGGYALDASTTCGHPGTLAAGRSCLIGVTLTPAALGPAAAGTLTIATNAANSPQTVSLSGTGVAQTTLFETAVAFGNVAVNQASAVHTVLFRNDQSVPLTITSLQLPSGGYAFATPVSQSPQCPASGSLGPGITCAIGLTLTPAALGPVPAGVLSIASSADTSPQTVALSGTGVVPVTLSASAINFGSTAVEEASVVHRITLTNNQSAVLSLSSLAVSGDGYALDPSTTCGHPGTLAGGASCVIGVTLTPTSVGLSLAGALTITTNANNSPQTVALSGMGVSQTTVFETSIAFGNVAVNQASAVHTILYRNNQAIPLTISALQLPAGGYAFATPVSQSSVCPASGTLAAGTTCAIGLTLTPTVLGAVAPGSLNIVSSADNSPQTVALSGTGVVPVTLSATSIGFGGTTVGQVSVVHRITLTNNQSATLSILSLQVSGSGYALDPSTTCGDPGTVAAGASCLIGVTLTPSVQGPAAAGVLTVVTNAANSPQAVALSGTGVTQTTLFQTSVAFGNVAINQASGVHTVLFRNNQSVPLMISSLQLPSGSGYAFATPISQSPQCPASGPLGAGITCAIGITLTPAALGPVPAGVLSIASDALASPQTVSLSGTGVVPVIPSVTSMTFAAQFEGVTSAPQTVTFTNQQASALVISSLVITGANAGDFAATNLCTGAVSVNAGPICSVSLTFTPTGTGTRTATLTINDGAQNAPLMITLSGQGNAPLTVSPTAITTYSAPVGTTSAYQTVSIMNATTAQTFHISALQLTGDFKQTSTTCGSLPYAISPGSSCNVTISFAPTVSGTRTGELQVVDDAVTSPQVVNLSGTGTSPITLSPTSLTYTAQKLGTLSAPQNVTLTNYESQQETFTLTPSANFTATSICADGVIRANSSCAVSVVFAPAATATPGPITGTLTVVDSATGAVPLYVSLIGSATTMDPPAAVAVVSPAAAAAGAVVQVTITGNGLTHFSNASTIKFTDTDNSATPSGITYSITGASPNSLNATLTIANGAVSGARDLEVDTPLAGGGVETALLNSAFLITAQSNVHTITAVNPACGNQGQTLNVDLTFSGMSFVAGTSYAVFGDGITVNSLAAGATPNDVVASISISNTTPVGGRTVTLVTGGDFATSTFGACQVGANNATLLSVTPNSEPQGFSGSITLTSSGTHFLQNATTVSIGGGVIVGDVNVSTTTPTTATAEVTVPANATIGAQDVTVATGGEIATLAGGFTVVAATPLLLSETPNSAQQGQTLNVMVTGNAYTNFLAGVTAQFGGEIQVNGYSAISANSVTVNITVSQNASAGSITANLIVGPTGNQQIFPFSFTVTPSSAAIVNVVPGGVPQGGQLTLAVTGRNTHWVQGTTMATFIQTPYCGIAVNVGTFPDATDGTLNVSVPANCPVGDYTLQIATGGEVVSATVQVYANTPSMTMNPSNGLPGTSFPVAFTGDFTHFDSSTTAVVSGEGVTLSPLQVGNGQIITATIAIAADAPVGGRTITLTTGTEVVTTGFEVSGTSISVLSPYEGPQSTTQDIVITGVNTHFVQGTTTVLFGPQITVNSVTVISPTELTVNITTSYLLNGTLTATPPGWQSLYVKTGSEEETASFLILAPLNPSILNVDPSSAAQGSTVTVTITGSLTNWVQGVTEAILGSGVTVNSLTINGPTTATASLSISPTASLGTNSVVMITGSEIEIGGGFTVTPGAANVVSVEPPGSLTQTGVWVVSQLQTSTLKLTAVGTHWGQGETTVNFGPGVAIDELTVINSTTATVQITVLSTAPVGFATLTVVTDGEVVSFPQALDIEEGFASLLSTSPGGGQQGATLNLQVLGRFTHWQQGVTTAAFSPAGDITVNSFTVVDSENGVINLTVNPTAYVDTTPYCDSITITTGSEQVTLPPPGQPGQFCIQQGPAQITAVSPATGLQGTTGTVTITGSATNFAAGITQVSFNDPGISVGTVTVTSPTSLTVPVSISTTSVLGYHTVTATTLGETASQQFAYQVNPNVATLNEAIPNSAVQGAPLAGQSPLVVRLIGQYSHFSAESTAVFGAGITVQSVSFVSLTEIDATVVIDPLSYTGVRNVTVTTPNVPCAELTAGNACRSGATIGSEIVSAGVFSVATGPAIISAVAPGTGNQGQEVVFTVTGSGTHWQQNFTQFWMDGIGQDLTVNSVVINSSTSATVDMTISPTAVPGARTASMVTAGEALSDAGAFVVTGGIPVITYLSPNNANPGTSQLLVTINGLDTMWDSTSTVDFGPGITVTSYQVDDPTHIEAVINIDAAAQIGYRTVVVTTGAQKLTGNFLVAAPAPPPTPYISFYYPYSGLTGQTLTIQFTGQFTHWDPGPINTPTTATFGDGIAVNTFQVTSPTTAVATVTIDSAAVTGQRLIVFTTGSEMESVPFSVVSTTPGTPGSVVPVLSLVDPGSAIQGAQNLLVTILGQYTAFDSTTTFSFGPGITVNGPPMVLGPTVARQSISVGQEAATGGYTVTSNTPGAPAGAQTAGGAVFYVTPSLALVSAVTPNIAKQGDTVTVDVSGQNTHWDATTVFQFGAGITVSQLTVNSATDATMTLSIPALASLGPTSVTAQTAGEVATLNNGFVVQAGTPLLLSSGPSSLPQQSSATFTILSQATNWTAANPPTVTYGSGVTVTNVNVTSATSLTAFGYIQPTTSLGYRDLTVTSGNQVLGLPNALYVTAGPAAINSVSPSSGGQGANLTAVQIMGTNTNWQQGMTALSFPEVLVNSFTVSSPTLITANITVNQSATPGQVSVTATTGGEVATETNAFTVIQTDAELLNANPNSGAQGLTENVTLAGLYSHFGANSVVSFGQGVTVNSITPNSSTSLMANITVQPTTAVGSRTVSVITGTESVSLVNGFQVTTGQAAILSLSPASGAQNTNVTVQVTGSQTSFASGVTTAAVGGGITVTGVTVADAKHASLNLSIPSSTATGAYNVTLTTGGEVATILGGFTVTAGTPQVSSVSPATGHQGDTNLSIGLTGLFTHFVNGTSTASFGAGITVNSLTVSDATDAVANITISSSAAVGSRTVTVATGGESAAIVGGFSVLAGLPALSSAMPGTAQAGATANVVVTGAFTNFQQGSTTVSFGAGVTVNSVTVASATQLSANVSVDPNATVGSRDITVTTGSQTEVLSGGFTVTPGTPLVTVINPNIGVPGSVVSITINGQYTNWDPGTTKVAFGPGITVGSGVAGAAGPVASGSANSIVVNLSIDPAAALGPRDVTITTGSEVETVPAGFTVQSTTVTPPTVISVSPAANAVAVSTNSSVYAIFSQPMDRTTITTSNVLLYLTSNPGQGNIAVPGSVSVDASGRELTFTPAAALAVNASYYFVITNGVTDASGNALGYCTSYFYTGFSASMAAPTVVMANPPVGAAGIGTNVSIQVEFSAQMNQATQAGLTVSAGGVAVPGSYTWSNNDYTLYNGYYYYYGNYACGYSYYYYYNDPSYAATCPNQGSVVTFTPSAPLQPNTTYRVGYAATLTDTSGNALKPGSFTFSTGAGTDTAYNGSGPDFTNYATNVGTNFAPTMNFAKPVDPLAINAGTLYLYNVDGNKYILGKVTLAADAMSATFTPSMPLLPNTEYDFHMSGGYFDVDGNYLYGTDSYFTTGAGAELAPPQVSSVFPADLAKAVPLNAQAVFHFSEPLDPNVTATVQITPNGGAAIAGTATLASDQVTLTFVSAMSLAPGTQFTVQVSGYQDMVGNVGAAFSSSFTTATSVAPLSVSTGIDASGNLITTGDTVDPHWTAINSNSPNPQPVDVVTPANVGWYSGWPANGPMSSWITVSPDAVPGPVNSTYSTTFNLTGYSLSNLCLTGSIEGDPYGTLLLNGNAITPQLYPFAYNGYGPYPLSIALPVADLNAGVNTLSYQFASNYSGYEGMRMQASVQTCGATITGGLTLTASDPVNGAGGIPTNASVTLTFNNPIDPATVNSSTIPVEINGIYYQVIAGNYTVNGNQVVFTPDSPFPVGTALYVNACPGLNDLAGDSYPYCQTVDAFTTAGTATPVTPVTPPFQVIAFAPAANAGNVGLRAPVVATFNRSVNPNTVNTNGNTDFALFQGDGQSPWCTTYMKSQDNATLQFSCGALPASSLMTASLNGGLQDFSGNALANFTSQFSTSQADSSTAGSLSGARPGTGSNGVSPNAPLVLFFNLPVNASGANSGLQVAQNNVAITGSVQVLDNGYTLQFTPSTPFVAGALIQWSTTSSLTDSTYGNMLSPASGYFNIAADTSAVAPVVQAVSPALYNTIATNSIIDIQFNVPLNPSTVNSTNVYLYDTVAGVNVAATYSQPQPNVVRIVPQANLTANATIYLYATNALQSTTSVPFGGSASLGYFYTLAVPDTTSPTVVSAVPYSGAPGVGVNVQPGFVFSKPIDPISVNASTFQVLNGTTALPGSYWVSSDDTRIEFVPNSPLPVSATLTMSLTGVQDQVGNPLSYTSHFTTGATPDEMTPVVVQTSIPSNVTVPLNSNITVQFSESMDVTTFNPTDFRLYDDDNTSYGAVAATLTWNSDQSVAYLVPAVPLKAGHQYTLYVNSGTDIAGNGMQSYSSYFYAGFAADATAPSVTAFSPLVGATGVGTNTVIDAAFSAPIDPTTLSGVTLSAGGTTVPSTAVLAGGNTVVQLVPQAPLTANTKYVVTIAGVKDPAGNMVATATNSFTTGATFNLTAATVVSVDPPNYPPVGTNVTPRMTFSKPLNPVLISNSSFSMYLVDTGQFIPLTVALSTNGLQVTLTPQIALLPNTEYRFNGNGGIYDQDGNAVSGGYYYFYTGDGAVTSSLTVTGVSPTAGATAVPLNAQIVVTVSATLDPTSVTQSSLQLLDNSSHALPGTVSQTDGQTLTFVPAANLLADAAYTVKTGSFTDANGNAVVPYSSQFSTGASAGTGGLTLTSTNITNGATNVSATQPVTLVFSQVINAETVNENTFFVQVNGSSSYDLAGSFAVSGSTVTFTPANPYPAGATLYVYDCGITDVLGEVLSSGCNQLLYFTVTAGSVDTTPLQILSVSPAKAAVNVGLEHSVSVTFNKSINPGSVRNSVSGALLYAGQNLVDNGSVSLSADNRTLYFNTGSLQSGVVYTIEFPAGEVSDFSGNTLAANFISSFTTTTDPVSGAGSVVGTSPGDGATGVPDGQLLTLYVNRPVNASTLNGNFVVTVNGQVQSGVAQPLASGYEVQFTPSSAYPAGAAVEWYFTNVQDIFGNTFNTDSGYFYVAVPVDPATAQPQLVATSPLYGSSTVPVNAQIDIEYSQPIDPASLNNINAYYSNFPASTYSLPTPNVLRVTPTSALSPSTYYYFCVNGLVGTSGVPAANACYAGDFTTVGSSTPDTTAGTVSIGPPNGSVNVGTNAYIRLQFSKPVDQTTVNSTNVQVTAGGVPVPGSWSYNNNAGDVVGANFSPLNPLPASSTILVKTSGMLDYAGNTFAAAQSQFTTAAMPDYETPSVSLDFLSGTTGIGTNAKFTCRYSQAMDPASITPSGTYLFDYAANAKAPVTYSFSPDLMSVTMTPTSALTADSNFTYTCYYAIDLTGVGQSNGAAYFTTGDGPNGAGPALVQANPPNGTANVALNDSNGPFYPYATSLLLQFSEPVAESSLGGVTLTPNGGSPIAITSSGQNGDTVVSVQLPSVLLPNTTYTFNVAGVTDYTGNLITPTTSSFTTGTGYDFISPMVSATNWTSASMTTPAPLNGASGVDDNATVSVVFSEPMDPVLIDGNHVYIRVENTYSLVPAIITLSPDYTTVYLTPTAPLAAGTIYDVITSGIYYNLTDIAGNPYQAQGLVATFTTQ